MILKCLINCPNGNIGGLEPAVESFNVDSDSSVSARIFHKDWQEEKGSLERKNPKINN